MSVISKKNFYKDFRQTNPALILGLIIISFGFYVINWIYLKNRDFESIDNLAPDSNRGAIIMMVIPFSWFFIIFIFKKLIFPSFNIFLGIFEIIGWGFVTFLLLKYFLDFSLSFGRITKTKGIIWFLGFFSGVLGAYAIVFHFYAPELSSTLITEPIVSPPLILVDMPFIYYHLFFP